MSNSNFKQLVKNLLTRKTWMKGALASNASGNRVNPDDSSAVNFCLIGAVQHCYRDPDKQVEVQQRISATLKELFPNSCS
jgi:hypothetical protein